uniref:Fe2OG dioxygenase domain-containing protein n=1 Tax=Corethron hystrix TaxID=216773 RepID=A0A7S1B8D3_9STRA
MASSHYRVSPFVVILATTSAVFAAQCACSEAFSLKSLPAEKVRFGLSTSTSLYASLVGADDDKTSEAPSAPVSRAKGERRRRSSSNRVDVHSDGSDAGKTETSSGPKGDRSLGPRGGRRSRRGSSFSRSSTSASGRDASSSPTVARKRAPHQFDHTKEEARPFVDALAKIRTQDPNEEAPALELTGSSSTEGKYIEDPHFSFMSLDEIFPGLDFSMKFANSKEFRTSLRSAIREDIFDTTPMYHKMSEKARKMLLLPDSSLQGSWRCNGGNWARAEDNNGSDKSDNCRMKKLTLALRSHLGPNAPLGDEFMDKIGSLCGSKPQTHWIDIVGVLDRRIPHSWHTDTGNCPNGDTRTVLLAFPPEDGYDGVGVYSHLIKLKREQWAPEGHTPNEPVLFGRMEEVGEEYIVRPRFCMGRELIMYRDIDVLHSSPDVAYRSSLMRFM